MNNHSNRSKTPQHQFQISQKTREKTEAVKHFIESFP